MSIQALGYVGIEATSPEDWAGFATGLLGLQLAERSAAQLVFRMDDRRQRLVVTPGARDGARSSAGRWRGPRPCRRWRRGWRMPASRSPGAMQDWRRSAAWPG